MKVLVTGATGFVGKALALRLKEMGAEVTGVGRNPTGLAQLEAAGVRAIHADLRDAAPIQNACQGQEIVFHTGALSTPWGRTQDFYQTNVTGTQNVIRGCEQHGVGRLVYVSTPSIYFRFAARLDVPEDAPLPAKPANEYAHSKLLAEAEIERAFARGLPVITIRPRAIFGPGDTAILPRLIDRLRTGKMPIIGDGQNIADLTYIDNVVDALILCATSPWATLGKKYNITNGEPVRLWEMIAKLCAELGYPFPRRRISYRVADSLATMLEILYALLPGRPEPPLTRYTVSVVSQSATLNIQAAKRDLGYRPRISLAEGFAQFLGWWKGTHP
jgi:nucleoside-diphosphate-sugar epimerase